MPRARAHPRRFDLLVLFGIAIAVRAAHLAFASRSPFFSGVLVDERGFDHWARAIAGGDIASRLHPVFFQPPLYPYALAALDAIPGAGVVAARLVQAVLGALLAPLAASIARRLDAGRFAAWTSGLFAAIHGPLLLQETRLGKETLAVLLAAVFLALLVRPGRGLRRGASTGLVLGLLALLRENALLLVPVLAVTAGLLRPRRPRWAAGLLLGAGIALAPVTAHNAWIGRDLVLTTYQGGVNLFIGSGPGANGLYRSLRPGRQTPSYEEADAVAIAEQASGRPLRPSEVSRWWTRRTLASILAEPRRFVGLCARKAALLLHHGEPSDTVDYDTFRAEDPVLLPTRLSWGLILPLALTGGFALSRRRRIRGRRVLLYVLVTALSILPFFVMGRYRLALLPAMLVLAGVGTAGLLRASRFAPRRFACLAAVLAAGLFLAQRGEPAIDPAAAAASTHWNAALLHLERGERDEAATRLRRALELRPGHAKAARTLADLELRAQRPGEAAAICRRAIAVHPGDAALHLALGESLKFAGDLEGAQAALRRSIALAPAGSAKAHAHLGDVLRMLGRPDEALAELEQALRLDPYLLEAYGLLVPLYRETGRREEAARVVRRARALPDLTPPDRARLERILEDPSNHGR